MKKISIVLAIITLLLAGLDYYRGGTDLILKGLQGGGLMLLEVVPLLLVAFLMTGLIQVMISKEFIKKWLGDEAGIKAILLGALAGALIPGGPYVSYPIAASFFIGGAEIGTVMSFLAAKNVWTFTRLPMEFALLGTKITVVRYIITVLFPILVGVLGNLLFSGSAEKIRIQMKSLTGGTKK